MFYKTKIKKKKLKKKHKGFLLKFIIINGTAMQFDCVFLVIKNKSSGIESLPLKGSDKNQGCFDEIPYGCCFSPPQKKSLS